MWAMPVVILSYSPDTPVLIPWHSWQFLRGAGHGSCLISLFWTCFWWEWATSVAADGCTSAFACWKLPPCRSDRWVKEGDGGDSNNNAGSTSSQARAQRDQQCWTAVLAKCLGPDSMPSDRENPKGKKAKQAKNKRQRKGPAKAPLHGLVGTGCAFGPGAAGGTWGFPTTDVVLSCSPWPCHTGPGHRALASDKGSILHLDWEPPCALELALNCNAGHAGASLLRYLSRRICSHFSWGFL